MVHSVHGVGGITFISSPFAMRPPDAITRSSASVSSVATRSWRSMICSGLPSRRSISSRMEAKLPSWQFNGKVSSDVEYGQWKERWTAWQKKVEQHLESKFGLRERNMFRNRVLFKVVQLPDRFGSPHHYRPLAACRREIIKRRFCIEPTLSGASA